MRCAAVHDSRKDEERPYLWGRGGRRGEHLNAEDERAEQ